MNKGYSPLYSSTTGPEGSIREEDSVNERLRVLIHPPNQKTGKNYFIVDTVQKGASTTFFVNVILYSFAIFVALSIAAALVVRFGGGALIESQLNSPHSNCTIETMIPSNDARGNLVYTVTVVFYDTNGVEHTKQLTIAYSDAQARGWGNGTTYLCIYKGTNLWVYDDVASEYSQLRHLWFLAFVCPFGVYLLWAAMYSLIHKLMKLRYNYHYFPRSISYRDDKNLSIVEWYDIPAAAHVYIYALLKTHFGDQQKTIAFRPSHEKPRSNVFRIVFIVYGFFLIATGLGLGVVFAGWLFTQYSFGLYMLAVVMAIMGLPLAFLGVYAIKLKWATEKVAYSDEISFTYSMSSNKLKGEFPA